MCRLMPSHLAFANIVSYMEDIRWDENTPVVFTSSTHIDLYMEQLKLHGLQVEIRVQSTRFKDRYHSGIALQYLKSNADTDAIHLLHTAKMIRN